MDAGTLTVSSTLSASTITTQVFLVAPAHQPAHR